MSLFLEPLKTSTLPGDVQPYRNLVYNGIYTVLESLSSSSSYYSSSSGENNISGKLKNIWT